MMLTNIQNVPHPNPNRWVVFDELCFFHFSAHLYVSLYWYDIMIFGVYCTAKLLLIYLLRKRSFCYKTNKLSRLSKT